MGSTEEFNLSNFKLNSEEVISLTVHATVFAFCIEKKLSGVFQPFTSKKFCEKDKKFKIAFDNFVAKWV